MEIINALGRRKSSVARVYLTEGTGKITINKRDLTEYFPSTILQFVVKQPLTLLDVAEKYDIKANLVGGGFTRRNSEVRASFGFGLRICQGKGGSLLRDQGRQGRQETGYVHLDC